ncbi:QRFP-like peptide receptor [Oculina patagonica]
MSVNWNTTIKMNGTSSCFNPTAEKIGKTFAYCVVLVVSLVGNTFIGIIVYKTKTMRKPINFFIVNMAMSDLLFSIFLFLRVITELYVDSWLISSSFGQAFCKLLCFFTNISSIVSTQSLILIAVDRFSAVVFPLRPPLIGSRLCNYFILVTWIVAMATKSPYLFARKLVEDRGKLVCEIQWEKAFGTSSFPRSSYAIAQCVLLFYIPFTLLAISYSIIVLNLKSQTPSGEPSIDAERKRMKMEQNVLKMAIAIVLGFAVCWLPFNILLFLHYFVWDNKTKFSCDIMRYRFIVVFMGYANSAVNPCICYVFSERF